jgi:ABC-2 type transport system permease protein/lipopolysaccharide transport system permease protein
VAPPAPAPAVALAPPPPTTRGPRTIPAEPPAELIFKRKVSLLNSMREVYAHRELTRSLVERDLRARYKQAILGFSWAIITPLMLMVVFNLFFKRVASFETGDVPYALFTYVGLVPWSFFSTAVNSGGNALLSNQVLVNKVYCPREVFPIAATISAAADAIFALSALFVLFAAYTFAPHYQSFWIIPLLIVQVMFTLGIVMLLSILIVYLRDIRHLLPIVLQFGLLGTPVAYPLSKIPGAWRGLYCFLNPLAPCIDGYRRAVLFGQAPQWQYLGLGALSSVILLTFAYRVFKRLEVGIADVA